MVLKLIKSKIKGKKKKMLIQIEEEANKLYLLNKENEENNRMKYKELEFISYLNKKVIVVSNEWENPVIGKVKEIQYVSLAKVPTFVVHDYITGEECLVFGKVFHYTDQKFEAIMKLTPFELCSLLYSDIETEYIKSKKEERKTKEELKEILIKNGFYN